MNFYGNIMKLVNNNILKDKDINTLLNDMEFIVREEIIYGNEKLWC